MSEKIIVPTLGESVTEATVSKWLKNEGENVSSDEPIVELETDKVNVEVPAPSSGVLESVSVKEGQTVNVGALLGIINDTVEKKLEKTKELKNYSPPSKNIQVKEKTEEVPRIFENGSNVEKNIVKKEEPLILNNVHEEKIIKKQKSNPHESIISPAASKMATEAKVDASKIEGTGKNGVVLKEDIMNLMGSQPPPTDRKIKHGPEERIKMTRLRLTIAKRLKEAQENAAILTTFNEIDMSQVISMRNQYKEEFQNKYEVKLGFMSFFVKACVIGLKNFPSVNAEIQDEEIVYKNYYNIGVAVGTDRGIVVHVLRETDEM